MPDTLHDLLSLIQSGWTQLVFIGGIIWHVRKIDLRGQNSVERLDRHETCIQTMERISPDQAVMLATIKEALSGIKLTLDRMYDEMRDKG